jgi:AAA+ ATPase superfamily predicted ATPase
MHSGHLDSVWKHSSIVVMETIGIDVDRQLVPLAFAIVEKENNGSWGWFLHLVRRVVVGPGHEICVISDKHVRILNAMQEVIPNHSFVHHRWCTRHLAQNLNIYDGIKENFKLFEEVYQQTDEKDFRRKLKELDRRTNEKGKEFQKGLMDENEKWAPACDKGGKHCGYMTRNMTEIFNSILRGVRSLPVTVIASFIFYKCNEWFVKCLVDA